VVDSGRRNGTAIKKRLVRDFNRVYECAACKNENFTTHDGVLMWNKKEIVLQLEHINGVNTDNRLENLTFLCPNCHAQTSTFCGMNGKKRKISQAWVEDGKID
jgi:Zn finger protein HypA/HybF involved in hydrogenase expression